MAHLFIVGKEPLDQVSEIEEEEVFELSREVKVDLETALRAVAFLVDFIDSVGGSGGLRECADELSKLEPPQ